MPFNAGIIPIGQKNDTYCLKITTVTSLVKSKIEARFPRKDCFDKEITTLFFHQKLVAKKLFLLSIYSSFFFNLNPGFREQIGTI